MNCELIEVHLAELQYLHGIHHRILLLAHDVSRKLREQRVRGIQGNGGGQSRARAVIGWRR